MKIHLITIFPESFKSYFESSIIWNAVKNGLFEIEYYKLNDFSTDKFKRVDDKAYGMHGQVISVIPLDKAINYVFQLTGNNIPVIYMSPGGDLLTQEKIELYSKEFDKDIIIICGHYEWIDQRIIDIYVTHQISIWEYVISSGELSTMVFIDALTRHIPWVLGNNKSLEEDSFSLKFDRQKEHPVYTRPEEFLWLKVPEVLLSWNHLEIEKWKKSNLK